MLNRPEWHHGVFGSFGAFIAGCDLPLAAFVIGQVLVTLYSPDKEFMKREVQKYSAIFAGAAVVVFLGHVVQHYFMASMGERLTKRVREFLFQSTYIPLS